LSPVTGPVLTFVLDVERVRQRVDLGEVERPARFQELGGDLGPALDVRQPAQHAEGGVDDVVAPVVAVREVVEVRLEEGRTVLQTAFGGQFAGHFDGLAGEVDAGHGGALPRPRQGSQPDEGLQV